MPIPCQDIIDDIEDLISSQDITPKERYSARKNVTVRSKRKKVPEEVPEPPVFDSIVPGTQTIYVKTWGCTHNNSDSEYMAGQLATYGYKLTAQATPVYHRFRERATFSLHFHITRRRSNYTKE